MDCRYLENLYDLFVLGALPPDEDILVQQHLDKHCSNCQDGIRRSALTVYALLETCPPVKSTAKQKAELLQRFRGC
jgi:hypothetical protein